MTSGGSLFYHSYFLPRRFGADGRLLGHGALVRSSQMDRDEAIRRVSLPQEFDPDLIEMVKKRLGYSDAEFARLMELPKHSYFVERTRWFWRLMCRMDLVPKNFYLKFTAPVQPPALVAYPACAEAPSPRSVITGTGKAGRRSPSSAALSAPARGVSWDSRT